MGLPLTHFLGLHLLVEGGGGQALRLQGGAEVACLAFFPHPPLSPALTLALLQDQLHDSPGLGHSGSLSTFYKGIRGVCPARGSHSNPGLRIPSPW